MANYPNLKKFLMVVGIIAIVFLFIFILLVVYLIVSKPFGVDINPLRSLTGTTSQSDYDHPLLSDEQEATLESIGVDLESVPTSISPEQQQCAVDALGQERVNQIISGSAPSLTDYLKAKDCF